MSFSFLLPGLEEFNSKSEPKQRVLAHAKKPSEKKKKPFLRNILSTTEAPVNI